MVLLEDPLTGDVPSRFQTEEDEELAQSLVQQYSAQPVIECEEGLEQRIVVFLVGPTAALLASTLFRGAQRVGSIAVPELQRLRSPYAEEFGGLEVIHTSQLLRLGAGASAPLLVASEKCLPPEQAATWAAAVLGALRPERLVVATTLAAMEYHGPGSPADEDLIFCLSTREAESLAASAAASSSGGKSGAAPLPPPLPSGTLLSGLPAALLARAARQGLPATAVAGVQMGPAPDSHFVLGLAGGVQGALAALGAALGQGQALTGAELLAEVQAATDQAYRSSASNSIFI